jgi:PIN domain nuclease of toxin-antitoxin system
MTYLLDTSVWLRAVSHELSLPMAVRNLFRDPQAQFALSVFSIWEVCKKHQIGKLKLPFSIEQWLDRALSSNISVLPLSNAIILDATRLPDFPNKDPADEIVTATARVHDLTLLTTDRLLKKYKHAKVKYFKPLKKTGGSTH